MSILNARDVPVRRERNEYTYEADDRIKQERGFAGSAQGGENDFSGASRTNVERRPV